MNPFNRLYVVLAICLVLSLFTGSVKSQLTCDDPFENGQPLFSTAFWLDDSGGAGSWPVADEWVLEGVSTDFCQRSISFDDVLSGGPPPDGIPPIDDPQFETIEQARAWLEDQSPVIALEIDGDARAYPLALLTWHEIANDEVGGIPVAVTFCPLCNSSIVFDRRVDDDVLRFGVSGLLRNSDLIMWDHLTRSWWQQFTGEGIVGVYTGVQLDILPSVVVSLSAFEQQYPDGLVLSRETGTTRDYGGNPYVGYDNNTGRPFLFRGDLDERVQPPTQRVLAAIIGGEAIAYPFSVLAEENVINDRIGEVDVAAFWQPGKASALDGARIDSSRDVGMAALYSRELDGQVLSFTVEDGVIRDEQTGSTWNVFGTAIEGETAGRQLRQVIAAPHFWFAWAAFRPETRVYGLDSE
jgi:hypothetical protein